MLLYKPGEDLIIAGRGFDYILWFDKCKEISFQDISISDSPLPPAKTQPSLKMRVDKFRETEFSFRNFFRRKFCDVL